MQPSAAFCSPLQLAEEQKKLDDKHNELGQKLEKEHNDMTQMEQNIANSLKSSLLEQGETNIADKMGGMWMEHVQVES
jgi:hypothetical protein